MTRSQASTIWGILVREAGATPSESRHQEFVHLHTVENCREYRFIGLLGHGGKYRSQRNRVDCYPEDENKERLAVIERTNKALSGLDHDLQIR